MVNNIPVKFKEHRQDDGLNNWFAEQYLESLAPVNGMKLRINACRIDKITKDSILVTNYFNYYSTDDTRIPGKSFTQENWFSKKIIAEVLITNEKTGF